MRLSREEKDLLRFIKSDGGYIKSSPLAIGNPMTNKLIKKGILEARVLHSYEIMNSYSTRDYYYISFSECGYVLLKKHPELLQYNAFSVFLNRCCTFVKRNWKSALFALILIIFAIALMT